MNTAAEVRALLADAICIGHEATASVIEEHQFTEHSAGDGYTEPREHWINCTCGIAVWSWQQYYMETDESPEDCKKIHLAMMLVAEVLKPKQDNTEENTDGI